MIIMPWPTRLRSRFIGHERYLNVLYVGSRQLTGTPYHESHPARGKCIGCRHWARKTERSQSCRLSRVVIVDEVASRHSVNDSGSRRCGLGCATRSVATADLRAGGGR